MEFNSTRSTAAGSPDYLLKVILNGDFAVGKTSTITRYVHNEFRSNDFTGTIGVDFQIKLINHDGKLVKLQLWDVSGGERFRTITNRYYKGYNGVLVLYDITNRSSFESVETYLTIIQQNASADCKWIILGNKADKEEAREVRFDEGTQLANRFGGSFFEVSAKSDYGINEAITELVVKMKEAADEKSIKGDPEYIRKLKIDYRTENKQWTCL